MCGRVAALQYATATATIPSAPPPQIITSVAPLPRMSDSIGRYSHAPPLYSRPESPNTTAIPATMPGAPPPHIETSAAPLSPNARKYPYMLAGISAHRRCMSAMVDDSQRKSKVVQRPCRGPSPQTSCFGHCMAARPSRCARHDGDSMNGASNFVDVLLLLLVLFCESQNWRRRGGENPGFSGAEEGSG